MLTTNPTYAVENNVSYFRGDDIRMEFALSTSSAPIDLVGSTINAAAKRSTTIVTFDVEETSLEEGSFAIEIPRADSEDMLGAYTYNVEVIDSNDKKLTRIYGVLTIVADVS